MFASITRRKVEYFGHVIRKNRLQRELIDGKLYGKRGRGRPRCQMDRQHQGVV